MTIIIGPSHHQTCFVIIHTAQGKESALPQEYHLQKSGVDTSQNTPGSQVKVVVDKLWFEVDILRKMYANYVSVDLPWETTRY